MDSALIERLARLRGIGDAYHDYRGELKHFGLDTKAAILRAMGAQVDDDATLGGEVTRAETARWGKFLPAVVIARGGRGSTDINISARDFGASIVWSVGLENGARREGVTSSTDCPEVWRGEVEGSWVTRRRFELPADLPLGYHDLEMKMGSRIERALIISAPQRCFEPATLQDGGRLWGVSVQLYTLRSAENWGMGDFNDLSLLIRWLAPRGAGFIGLNPLHALAPADPDRGSPYSASSRHFLNVLYIAIPAVPEFEYCMLARERFMDPRVQDRLRQLKERDHVDYFGVAQLKFEFFELLYRDFREHHLNAGGARARSFREFVAAGGALLQTHARFDAIDRHFRRVREAHSGWHNWPEEYRDLNGRAAARFVAENPQQVELFVYLQWLAHEQLKSAQSLAREAGMPVGLYGDYAVGANPGGSETWGEPQVYALGAEIGAPPDPLALKGQGWGIPPQDPNSMMADRLQSFVRLIRNNMRYYGALRLDHVMSLFRLWWVPQGRSPMDGAYVHYPLPQILAALAVESARSGCLVVGEDLGVVPDEMRQAMPDFGLYHYKVLLFEKVDGRFRRPEEYVRHALATVTTHDMPTLRSYWEGRDIELRRGLNLYPSTELEREVAEERAQDRELLLSALQEQGLKPASPARPGEPFTAELAQALHVYLASSASALVALQLEDLLGMIDPVNVPGTHHEYPNWQRKLIADVETMAGRDDLNAQLDRIHGARERPPR